MFTKILLGKNDKGKRIKIVMQFLIHAAALGTVGMIPDPANSVKTAALLVRRENGLRRTMARNDSKG